MVWAVAGSFDVNARGRFLRLQHVGILTPFGSGLVLVARVVAVAVAQLAGLARIGTLGVCAWGTLFHSKC